jgi:hypothetical protein
MGSTFLSSSDFLFLPPFICLPGELRALALLGAPLLPLSSRTPPLPWLRGYGRAPLPAVPLRKREDGLLYPSSSQGELPSDRERSRSTTPLIREATTRRCRAGFRRCSQFLSQRPQGFRPRDWETVTADPGGPVSHEAGRLTDLVGQYYTLRYSTSDSICLYNVKNRKTCSGYLSVQKNIIVILVSPATDKFYLSLYD